MFCVPLSTATAAPVHSALWSFRTIILLQMECDLSGAPPPAPRTSKDPLPGSDEVAGPCGRLNGSWRLIETNFLPPRKAGGSVIDCSNCVSP